MFFFYILIFNHKNELLLQRQSSDKLWTSCYGSIYSDDILETVSEYLKREMGIVSPLIKLFSFNLEEHDHHVFFSKTDEQPKINFEKITDFVYISIPDILERVKRQKEQYTTHFQIIIDLYLPSYLHRIIYNNRKNISQRFKYPHIHSYNLDIYSSVYQSQLCQAIKTKLRIKEGQVRQPACLDFGVIRYHIANHFGFCLGVANAIDIAYKALAENKTKNIYLLSELIHNKFVNDDLKNKKLRFLQNDKGIPYRDEDGVLFWDKIQADDIVIIPAFGARLDDKNRLIAKGIDIITYDATCRLVENVWLRGKKLGESGYTLILHGKSEHEETKATYSYISEYAPVLIVRDYKESQILAKMIENSDNQDVYEELYQTFAPDKYGNAKYSSNFDPTIHLKRIAVINQTTLLANDTLEIVKLLKNTIINTFGQDNLDYHFGKTKDTLCYATNANQGALEYMLKLVKGDLAIVVGGKNSSNTSQLYKMLNKKIERVFYIQGESNILNKNEILNFDFEKKTVSAQSFLIDKIPLDIILTGGASCPDGIIQQVITKINSFYPEKNLRSIDLVLKNII